MKKIIIVLVAASFLAGLVTGCSGRKAGIEEDVIAGLRSGFLYTTAIRAGGRDEDAFLEEREKAVGSYIKKIRETAGLSSKLNKGLEKYENNLLDYIESIKDPDDTALITIRDITGRMMAYDVIIGSLQDEISRYLKAKPANEVAGAIINTYMMEAVCDSVLIQNEYITWLADATAAVCCLLEGSSPRKAAKLLSSSSSIFDKSIAGHLGELVHGFDVSAEMYAYIRSADYYASGYFLEEAEKGLDILKGQKYDGVREEVLELQGLFDTVKANIRQPGILKTVYVKYKDSLLIKTVVAGDNGDSPLEKGMLALDAAKSAARDKYDKAGESDIKQLDVTIEKAKQEIDEKGLSLSETVNGRKEQYKTVSADSKVMIEETWEAKLKRLAALALISVTQNSIKSSSAGVDAQYDKIVRLLVERLKDQITKLTPEQQKEIDDLINGDLEAMLGGGKAAFVNYILNEKADVILNRFNEWKNGQKGTRSLNYSRSGLVSLINSFGFKIEDTAKDDPGGPDTVDEGDMKIVASYDLLKRISPGESNESAMMIIYGWSDPTDYTKYDKKENRDKDGNLSTLYYLDANGEYVGWYTRIYADGESHRYYFPGEKHRSIEINRRSVNGEMMLINVKYTDEKEMISSGISFTSGEKPELQNVWSTAGNRKDGLNMLKGSGKVFVDLSSMGDVLESYVYFNDILIEEMYYSYVGDTVARDVRKYYDDGGRWTSGREIGTKQENQYVSFKYDGPFYAYNRNGNPSIYAEYREGIYNGKVVTYHEDGTVQELITYSDGKKDGKTYRNHSNGKVEYEGEYRNDLREGTWYSFLSSGDPESEIGYKEGVNHGTYHIYATEESGTQAEAIHVIGQYEDNKKTGIWVYGYHNEGYVEKYLYENDIKIWMEMGNTRTYYNPDGTVKSTEKIN